jgi:hypothetical protein
MPAEDQNDDLGTDMAAMQSDLAMKSPAKPIVTLRASGARESWEVVGST